MQVLIGNKQLECINDFGKYKATLDYSAYGTGKTVGELLGLTYCCTDLYAHGIEGLGIMLIGKSAVSAKRNMGNVLSQMCGKGFQYTASKSDGKSKDAVLFGQHVFFCGFNDAKAEERIRGLSAFCVLHDEAIYCTKEQYKMLKGRLRPQDPAIAQKVNELGYRYGFYVGTTNPDAPTHWMKEDIDKGITFDKVRKWRIQDAVWPQAREYYLGLKEEYKDNPVLMGRYLKGNWTAAEGMCWSSFGFGSILKENDPSCVSFENINFDIFQRVVIGIDWGDTHCTSIVVMGVINNRSKYVVYEEHTNNKTTNYLCDRIKYIKNIIKETLQPFKKIYTYVDAAGGAYTTEMDNQGLKYDFAEKSYDYFFKVDNAFATAELTIFGTCHKLIHDIYGYSFKEIILPGASLRESINRVNDDTCDALRYAYVSDKINCG